MKTKKKYGLGTSIKDYIEDPNTELTKDNINVAKAFSTATPVADILGVLGNLGMTVGTKMMTNNLLPGSSAAYGGQTPPISKFNKDSREQWKERYNSDTAYFLDYLDKKDLSTGKTLKEIITNASKDLDIDPTFLMSTALAEGLDRYQFFETGDKAKDSARKMKLAENKIDGHLTLGLDTIGNKESQLRKGGYLREDLKFKVKDFVNEKNETVKTANFENLEDAVYVMAGLARKEYDDLIEYAQENNIELTPEQEEYFTDVAYNAGAGNARKMLSSYSKKGYLKDNNFITEAPDTSWAGVRKNVQRRYGASKGLKESGLLGDYTPVEVEGGEVYETADGQVGEFKGNKHEQGGIDTLLAPGTTVTSDRIFIDGVSLAERKKDRVIVKNRSDKNLSKVKFDKLEKTTNDRLSKNNSEADYTDMLIQTLAQATANKKSNGKIKAEYGLNNPIVDFMKMFYNQYNQGDIVPEFDGTSNDLHKYSDNPYKTSTSTKTPSINPGDDNDTQGLFGKKLVENIGKYIKDNPGLPGNALSVFGVLDGMNRPRKTVMNNRATDTPNVNYLKNVGEDALQSLMLKQGMVDGVTQNQLQDLELSKRGLQSRLRNTSRGVNTSRALDIATELQSGQQERSIRNNQTQQLSAILSEIANNQMAKGQIQAQGEQARDLADRQDKDNYYTQLMKADAFKSNSLQHLGGMINEMVRNREDLSMLDILKDEQFSGMNDQQKLAALLQFMNFGQQPK